MNHTTDRIVILFFVLLIGITIGTCLQWLTTPIQENVVTKEVIATTTISVLEEEQKCEEAGGEFSLTVDGDYYPNEGYKEDYTLDCAIYTPSKKLFEYKIKES
jgi:hypothetical protein